MVGAVAALTISDIECLTRWSEEEGGGGEEPTNLLLAYLGNFIGDVDEPLWIVAPIRIEKKYIAVLLQFCHSSSSTAVPTALVFGAAVLDSATTTDSFGIETAVEKATAPLVKAVLKACCREPTHFTVHLVKQQAAAHAGGTGGRGLTEHPTTSTSSTATPDVYALAVMFYFVLVRAPAESANPSVLHFNACHEAGFVRYITSSVCAFLEATASNGDLPSPGEGVVESETRMVECVQAGTLVLFEECPEFANIAATVCNPARKSFWGLVEDGGRRSTTSITSSSSLRWWPAAAAATAAPPKRLKQMVLSVEEKVESSDEVQRTAVLTVEESSLDDKVETEDRSDMCYTLAPDVLENIAKYELIPNVVVSDAVRFTDCTAPTTHNQTTTSSDFSPPLFPVIFTPLLLLLLLKSDHKLDIEGCHATKRCCDGYSCISCVDGMLASDADIEIVP
jgi:hypothetical protein